MPVRIESHLYELARQYKKLNENIATDLDSAVETEALVAKTHFLSRFLKQSIESMIFICYILF